MRLPASQYCGRDLSGNCRGMVSPSPHAEVGTMGNAAKEWKTLSPKNPITQAPRMLVFAHGGS